MRKHGYERRGRLVEDLNGETGGTPPGTFTSMSYLTSEQASRIVDLSSDRWWLGSPQDATRFGALSYPLRLGAGDPRMRANPFCASAQGERNERPLHSVCELAANHNADGLVRTPFSPNGTLENQWVAYSKSAVLGVFTNASIQAKKYLFFGLTKTNVRTILWP